MSIPTPNLDDRDFLQLLNEAVERVRAADSAWTDLGPSDPGVTLLEAFAHLTEVMIYRLNRVPEKAYRTYLNIIGTRLRPARAAEAVLRFSRAEAEGEPEAIEVSEGTRVQAGDPGRGEPIEFVVTEPAVLPADEEHVDARAYQCELVAAEHVGVTTGEPGQVLRVADPPIVDTAEEDDLLVAVEAAAGESVARGEALRHEGTDYHVWREVDHFADVAGNAAVYVADRNEGTIMFAPAVELTASAEPATADGPRALARVPPPRRDVRVWYRTGGGPAGNVAAGTLTELVDAVPGLEVTNPERATGGRDAESPDHALIRGPQEFHARDRAVTAGDYELIATRSGAVSRARAFARSAHWTYAPAGSVEVVIVPFVEADARPGGRVTRSDLEERSTPRPIGEVASQLEARRPLGVDCTVTWAKAKAVTVNARIGIRSDEDAAAVRKRVLGRLHRTINPLPTASQVRASQGRRWPGWPFGQSLRASDVYDILLAEPGVAWADQVRLHVDEVPDTDVEVVAADQYQPETWYVASGTGLFRSLNDCTSWEPVRHFPGEVTLVEPYPREPGRVGLGERPGFLAVATQQEGEGSRAWVSRDLGETWDEEPAAQFGFPIEDIAWIQRDDVPTLLVATRQGLYEQALAPDATPGLSSVDPDNPELGFYRVLAYTQPDGNLAVVLAAQRTQGTYRSGLAGRSGTFVRSGLDGEDIRTLALQYEGAATFLWAGAAAEGGDPGQGCFRARLEEQELSWQPLTEGWEGGSCWAIEFLGAHAYGASHLAGVQRLSLRGDEQRWWRPAVDCGLPLREVGRFHPVRSLAADADRSGLVTGGPAGVYRSVGDDETVVGEDYEHASRSEFDEAVALPPMWLFVSGEHEVEIVRVR